MIFIESNYYGKTIYIVEQINGSYTGWSDDYDDAIIGCNFRLCPNEDGFIQAFLAPSIIGKWSEK